MRIRVLIGSFLIAAAIASSAVRADSDDCCAGAPASPRVVRALPPTPFVIPPTGYVLDPSDAAPPFYGVNRGGNGLRATTYVRPTDSERGHAYSDVDPDDFPYAVRYGYGPRYGYRVPAAGPAGDLFARPAGVPPYRTAPSARIIHVPSAN
jgi:hypothetical protein